jgi:hypothetical protein
MCGEVSALPSYVITLSGYSDRYLVEFVLFACHDDLTFDGEGKLIRIGIDIGFQG